GASSGLGRGIALALSAEGYCVALTGRDQQALKDVAGLAQQRGITEAFVVVGDVGKDDDCANIITSTLQTYGRLDLLVNNAGIIVPGSCETLSIKDFDHQMNINTRAAFLLTKLAVPHLKLTKGNIVNVSSISGLTASPGVVAYNMSKAALDQLTRCVALEMAPHGVRVNSVNPGLVPTNIHFRAGFTQDRFKSHLSRGAEVHALGRNGTVEEVAQTVVFLASPSSSFITGITLPVDGGRTVMTHDINTLKTELHPLQK
ncbi:unnamed protein product, partial [Meganyctiphanes norvegica]